MASIDLVALPPEIIKANGNMFAVFNIIYNKFSQPHVEQNYGNNSGNYSIKPAPIRTCIFIMPDKKRLKFITSAKHLDAYPGSEIAITTTSTPDTLYLDTIGKSDKLKGADATKYAFEIAAALGAKWLTIWDAASIECNESDPYVHAYPLSLYRALTRPDVHSSWYENVAFKHGYSANATISSIYNYVESINKLRSIKIVELLTYYKIAHHLIDSGTATKYIFIDNIKDSGSISGNKSDFDTNPEEKTNVIAQLRKIREILSVTKASTIAEFLKDPMTPCLDKGYLLRSFPGYGNIRVEIPNILFNDKDEEPLLKFPYLEEFLNVAKASSHPIIKLHGGNLIATPKNLTIDKLIPLMDGYKRIQPSKTPLCIIKYGPPGSGKTSADKLIKRLFHINLSKFTHIDKDKPLVALKSFRNGSMKIIKTYEGVTYREQKAQEEVQSLQDAQLEEKDKDGFSISDKIPILFQRAFDYNFNILWETTCQSAQSQKLMDRVFESIPKIYRIIVLFPIISYETAKQRVIERAEAHLLESPPYYRPVPTRVLRRATDNSHQYFLKEIIPRLLSGEIHQLYSYDNETTQKSTNYKTIKNRNVVENRSLRYRDKRLAANWLFGLEKGRRKIILDGRPKAVKAVTRKTSR